MHVCNCLVSIRGDVANKAYRTNVSVPEMMLLQLIHGEGAVHDIEYVANKKMNQMELREELARKYPKFQRQIVGIWQDNGGKFPGDVRKMGWPAHFFKPKHPSAHDDADKDQARAMAEVGIGGDDSSTEEEAAVL